MGWKTLAIVGSAGLLAAAGNSHVAWAATGSETGTYLVRVRATDIFQTGSYNLVLIKLN